jgi:DNA-binding Xre family transcriptional regulator
MKRALLSAVTAALATAAVLATVGFGASSKSTTRSSSNSSTSSQTQSGPPKTMKQVYEEMQKQRAAQQKKLAEAIGVSVADLEQAQDKLKADRLAADVKANRLTQAQADAIEACQDAPLTCDRSNLPAGGPRGHRDGQRPDRDQYAKDLAAALNVDVDKVTKALESTRPARPSGEGFGGRGHRGGPGHGGPGGPMGGPGMMG